MLCIGFITEPTGKVVSVFPLPSETRTKSDQLLNICKAGVAIETSRFKFTVFLKYLIFVPLLVSLAKHNLFFGSLSSFSWAPFQWIIYLPVSFEFSWLPPNSATDLMYSCPESPIFAWQVADWFRSQQNRPVRFQNHRLISKSQL